MWEFRFVDVLVGWLFIWEIHPLLAGKSVKKSALALFRTHGKLWFNTSYRMDNINNVQ